MKRFLRSAAASLILAATTAATAAAQDPWYRIEVVIFERPAVDARGERLDPDRVDALAAEAVRLRWPALEHAQPGLLRAPRIHPWADLPRHSGGHSAFVALGEQEHDLGEAHTRLARDRRFQPLLHVAWVQPVTTDPSFRGLRLAPPPPANPPEATGLPLTPLPALRAEPGKEQAGDTTRLDGVIRLSRSRFLHLFLDLRLRPDEPDAEDGAAVLLRIPEPEGRGAKPRGSLYRLAESRRVRRGETHYFDHPRFGAIVRLTRLEAGEADEE